MKILISAKRGATLCVIAALALVGVAGCSGLTSAGLPAARNRGTGGGNGTSGEGSAHTIQATVSSTSLTFGNVAVGTTSTQQMSITNTGSKNVTVTENAVSGAGFAASGIGSGLILNPAQSATLEVSFTPASAGQSTGTVPVVSDAWSSAVIITLTGTGTQPVAHVATLAWDPISSVASGYNAYRSVQSGGPYTRLNTSPLPGTSYADATVASGQIYFYVVTAVDFFDVESGYSNEVSASIP